jgi:hypothetical protein
MSARFDIPRNAERDTSGQPYVPPTLGSAELIGVMGDWHGDLGHAAIVTQMFASKGVKVLLQLGDFGVIWPGSNWHTNLAKLGRMLAENGQALFFVDGNHEFFPRLLEFPISDDGVRWIAYNVGHLPRGYRTSIGGGTRKLAALGGANSHDREWRREGESWWPEEQISPADLVALGTDPVDVLVGHESPAGARTRVETGASGAEMQYADESRKVFVEGLLQVRPHLTLGGHYHRHVDQVMTIDGTPPLDVRAVILDEAGATYISQAILDPRGLNLQFFYRDGRPAGHTRAVVPE